MNEREIIQAALGCSDVRERQAYLARACGADSDLRRRIETLLAAHDSAGPMLNRPAFACDPSSPTIVQPLSSNADAGDGGDDEIDLTPDFSFLSPSTKPGSIGTLGHYEILQILGRGAFGIVFKAFDEKLHRLVAIKAMNPQLAATSPPRKRFLREARSVAAVKHENIVQIYAVEEQPLPYLVMEYVEGQTLQQKLDGTGPLEVSEFLSLGRQMAAGLSAAHEKGLIHRDIKPGNILIEFGAEQKVKITDFGLARAADDATMTRTGTIAGTPMYMAPEQATGQPLDHRADLFSLGSVLYQMACGRPPFRGPNAIAVLRRVVDEPPRPVKEIWPEVPDWLCRIVDKLHAKSPDARYQSARELAELLGRCQAEWQSSGRVTAVAPFPASPVTSETVELKSAAAAGVRASTEPRLAVSTPRRPSLIAAMLALIALVASGGLAYTVYNGVAQRTLQQAASRSGDTSPRTSDPQTSDGPNESAATVAETTKAALVPIDFEAERQNAEWVLQTGGTLTVESLKGWIDFNKDKPPFNEPFVVRAIELRDAHAMTDADLVRVAQSRYLEEMTVLNASKLTPNSVQTLAQMPRLKLLNISSPNIPTSALDGLRRSPSLDYLKISGDMIDDRLGFVQQLPTLRRFQIYDWRSVRPDLTLIAEAKRLHTLELAIANPPDRDELAALRAKHGRLRILFGLESFRSLEPDPVHEAAKALIGLGVECQGGHATLFSPKRLTIADLDGGHCWTVDSARIPTTVQLSAADREKVFLLDVLHFSADGQRDADLLAEGLSQSHRLATVALPNSDLTDAGLASLQNLPALRGIAIPGSKVTSSGVERFHEALPGASVTSDFGTFESYPVASMQALSEKELRTP